MELYPEFETFETEFINTEVFHHEMKKLDRW